MSKVTALITVWKRNHLQEQLDKLLAQTYLPEQIVILQNEHHIDAKKIVNDIKKRFAAIHLIQSDLNLKYFIRFSLASVIETEYILLLDDDVMPGPRWIETCLEKSRLHNAVVSCSGRLIPVDNFTPEAWGANEQRLVFIGDFIKDYPYNFCQEDTFVDYGCNSYFIRSEWMQHFWSVWPATYASGEDIHLSASLRITRSIPTMVPKQLSPETSGNLKKIYGADEVASWRDDKFVSIREKVLRYMIDEKGWKPLLWQQDIPMF